MSSVAPDPSGLAALKSVLDLPEQVLDLGCGLVRDLVGEPVKVAGGMLGDQFYWWQWRNRVRIAHRAAEILEKDGIARRVVPPAFLLQLLDAAGNVEDPDLQEMWARLLASGVAADEHQHPMWVGMLRQMSAADARAFVKAIEATDAEGVPFAPPETRPAFAVAGATDENVRLAALDLVVLVHRHARGTPPEARASTAMNPFPVARLSGVGAQFRRAVFGQQRAES